LKNNIKFIFGIKKGENMAFLKSKLLDAIEYNLDYIFGSYKDEYDIPYKEVYIHELGRIASDTQKYLSTMLYTKEEIITLLRADFIGTFSSGCINYSRAIFEKIINDYYRSLK
jgi:hypothetical protein